MDVMQRRRGLMMSMAGGADYVKGAFTVPDDANNYVINFGKTFSNYLFLIEANEDSKEAILDSGATTNLLYEVLGIFPTPQISAYSSGTNAVSYRINPSTQGTSAGDPNITTTTSSVQLACSDLIGGSVNGLYRGLAYNYYIVEIK